MIVLWGMVGVSALACGLIALTAFRPRAKLLAAGIGIYGVLYVLGVLALPQLVQAFVVRPSELSRETPYLKDYIEFTRNAYKLNAIQETAYPALTDLTPDVIARNQDTIQNIRLWDSRPLLQTYQQTQAIRLYYQFYNVDTDRYHLADGYHQVMLVIQGASRGASDTSANMGQRESAVYSRVRVGHEFRVEDHRRRFSSVSNQGYSPGISIRRTEHHPACNLLWRGIAGLQDCLDWHQGV